MKDSRTNVQDLLAARVLASSTRNKNQKPTAKKKSLNNFCCHTPESGLTSTSHLPTPSSRISNLSLCPWGRHLTRVKFNAARAVTWPMGGQAGCHAHSDDSRNRCAEIFHQSLADFSSSANQQMAAGNEKSQHQIDENYVNCFPFLWSASEKG